MLSLWYILTEEILPTALTANLHVLSFEEKSKADNFKFAKDRHNYLLRRIAIRKLSGSVLNIAPANIRFSKNPYGKPSIVPEQNSASVDFSISFTHGIIVIAFSNSGPIGIDVESINKPRNRSVARDFFAPKEVADLERIKEAEQMGRFYTYWTLKEAYIKAQGKGLAIDLSSFAFILEGDNIDFIDYTQIERSQDWSFDYFNLTPNYLVAAAGKRTKESHSIKECLQIFKFDPITEKAAARSSSNYSKSITNGASPRLFNVAAANQTQITQL